MLDRLRRLIPGLGTPAPVVPVVRVAGPIGMVMPFRPGVTMASLASALDRAFAVKDAPAVAIVINSPGGSPVQSSLIARRIRQLSREKNLPVIAFVEDVAASGGYWLACAADEVFVDASSIVGSIGVISAGFGFPELLKKLGVERRVHTSGDKKAMLDSFRPEQPAEVEHLKALQAQIHTRFIAWVKERRGLKLKGPEGDLFSGAFWTGEAAVALGLADGLGDLRGVLTERFGRKVRLLPMERRKGFLRSLMASRIGAEGAGGEGRLAPNLGEGLIAAAEERFLWSRFGL